jgi:hypothetical protein
MILDVYVGMTIRVCSSVPHFTPIVFEYSNTKIIVS